MTLSQAQRNYDAMTPPEDYVYSDDVEREIERVKKLSNCDRVTAIAILQKAYNYV